MPIYKSEQKLNEFEDISPEHLLQRYNVALAQAVSEGDSRSRYHH
jgi:predicted nuclease of restriction endonuclease-like RecB superfamily